MLELLVRNELKNILLKRRNNKMFMKPTLNEGHFLKNGQLWLKKC